MTKLFLSQPTNFSFCFSDSPPHPEGRAVSKQLSDIYLLAGVKP